MAEFHVERFDPDAVDKTNDENQVDIDYREWWKQIYGMNIITIKSYNFGCRSLYINLSVTQALTVTPVRIYRNSWFSLLAIIEFICELTAYTLLKGSLEQFFFMRSSLKFSFQILDKLKNKLKQKKKPGEKRKSEEGLNRKRVLNLPLQ